MLFNQAWFSCCLYLSVTAISIEEKKSNLQQLVQNAVEKEILNELQEQPAEFNSFEKRRLGPAKEMSKGSAEASSSSESRTHNVVPKSSTLLRGTYGKRDDDTVDIVARAGGLRGKYGKRDFDEQEESKRAGNLRGRYGKRAGNLRGKYGKRDIDGEDQFQGDNDMDESNRAGDRYGKRAGNLRGRYGKRAGNLRGRYG